MLVTQRLRGLDVVDRDGVSLGVVVDTWPIDGGGEPELALIAIGTRFPSRRYVPLRRAAVRAGMLMVPMTSVEIDDAPCANDKRWGNPADLAKAYWMQLDD